MNPNEIARLNPRNQGSSSRQANAPKTNGAARRQDNNPITVDDSDDEPVAGPSSGRPTNHASGSKAGPSSAPAGTTHQLHKLKKDLKRERRGNSNTQSPLNPGWNTLDTPPSRILRGVQSRSRDQKAKSTTQSVSLSDPRLILPLVINKPNTKASQDAIKTSRRSLDNRAYIDAVEDYDGQPLYDPPPQRALSRISLESQVEAMPFQSFQIPASRSQNGQARSRVVEEDSSTIPRGSVSPSRPYASTVDPADLYPIPGSRRPVTTPHRNVESGPGPSTTRHRTSLGKAAPPISISDEDEVVERVELPESPPSRARGAYQGSSGRSAQHHGGAFGSHEKPRSQHGPVGRGQSRSTSPTKRRQPGKDLIASLHRSMTPEQSEDEPPEPIEDPDGPYVAVSKDADEFSIRPLSPDKKQVEQPIKTSSSPEIISGDRLRTKAKRPMRPREVKNDKQQSTEPRPVSKTSNGPIPSSNIKRALAPVALAYLLDSCEVLHISTCSIDGLSNTRSLVFTGSGSGDLPPLCRIPLDCISHAKVHWASDFPTMILDFDLKSSKLTMTREEFGKMTDSLQSEQLMDLQVIIGFEKNSDEGSYLAHSLVLALDKIAKPTLILPEKTAFNLREQFDNIKLESRSSRTRRTRQGISEKADPANRSGLLEESKRQKKRKDSFANDADSSDIRSTGNKGKQKELDPTQSKLSFPPQKNERVEPTRRSARHTYTEQKYMEIDSDGEKVERPPELPAVAAMSMAERTEKLFSFPLSGRAEIDISKGDRHRIKSDDFLNDTIIEFGLKFITSQLSDVVIERIHRFNSFFYGKVADRKLRPTADGWPAYDSVKRWTKNKNIFDKQFIVIPINESYHWYLAVIYNPAAILQEQPPKSLPANPHATRARVSTGEDNSVDDIIHDDTELERRDTPSAADMEGLIIGNDSPPVELMAEDGDKVRRTAIDIVPRAGLRIEDPDESMDPLNVIDQEDGAGIDDVQHRTDKLSIGSASRTTSVRGSSPGAPIETLTTRIFQAQHLQRQSPSPEKAPSPPRETPKEALKPDLKIWGSDQCWIFTFDSLGGSHRAVHTVLNRWLHYEARDKGRLVGHDNPSDAQYCEARVPQQPNFSDCGLYLIHYAQQLLNRPQETITFIQRAPPRLSSPTRIGWENDMRDVWQAKATSDLRATMLETVDNLTKEYRELHQHDEPEGAANGDMADPGVEVSQESIAIVTDFGLPPMPGAFPMNDLVPTGDVDHTEGASRQPSVDPNIAEVSTLDVPPVPKEHSPVQPSEGTRQPGSPMTSDSLQADGDGASEEGVKADDHDSSSTSSRPSVLNTDPRGFGDDDIGAEDDSDWAPPHPLRTKSKSPHLFAPANGKPSPFDDIGGPLSEQLFPSTAMAPLKLTPRNGNSLHYQPYHKLDLSAQANSSTPSFETFDKDYQEVYGKSMPVRGLFEPSFDQQPVNDMDVDPDLDGPSALQKDDLFARTPSPRPASSLASDDRSPSSSPPPRVTAPTEPSRFSPDGTSTPQREISPVQQLRPVTTYTSAQKKRRKTSQTKTRQPDPDIPGPSKSKRPRRSSQTTLTDKVTRRSGKEPPETPAEKGGKAEDPIELDESD